MSTNMKIFSEVCWSRVAKEAHITPLLRKATQVLGEVTTLANEIVQHRVEDLIHGLEKVKQFMKKYRVFKQSEKHSKFVDMVVDVQEAVTFMISFGCDLHPDLKILNAKADFISTLKESGFQRAVHDLLACHIWHLFHQDSNIDLSAWMWELVWTHIITIICSTKCKDVEARIDRLAIELEDVSNHASKVAPFKEKAVGFLNDLSALTLMFVAAADYETDSISDRTAETTHGLRVDVQAVQKAFDTYKTNENWQSIRCAASRHPMGQEVLIRVQTLLYQGNTDSQCSEEVKTALDAFGSRLTAQVVPHACIEGCVAVTHLELVRVKVLFESLFEGLKTVKAALGGWSPMALSEGKNDTRAWIQAFEKRLSECDQFILIDLYAQVKGPVRELNSICALCEDTADPYLHINEHADEIGRELTKVHQTKCVDMSAPNQLYGATFFPRAMCSAF